MHRRGVSIPNTKLKELSRARTAAPLAASGALLLKVDSPLAILRQERLFARTQLLTQIGDYPLLDAKKSDTLFQKILKRILGSVPYEAYGFFGNLPVELYSTDPAYALLARQLLRKRAPHFREPSEHHAIRIYHDPHAGLAHYGVRQAADKLALFDLAERRVLLLGSPSGLEISEALETMASYLHPDRTGLLVRGHATTDALGEHTSLVIGGAGALLLPRDRRLVGQGMLNWSDRGISSLGAAGQTLLSAAYLAHSPNFWQAALGTDSMLEGATLATDGSISLAGNEMAHATYPLASFAGVFSQDSEAKAPTSLILLSSDPLGALPAFSELDANQAHYHFLSGYGAQNGGNSHFLACFGAAGKGVQSSSECAHSLYKKIQSHQTKVWLLSSSKVSQMAPDLTRAILSGIQSGDLSEAPGEVHPVFGFRVPKEYAGIDPTLLRAPEGSAVEELALRFKENFSRFEAASPAGGPRRP